MENIEVTVRDLIKLKPQIILNDPAFQGRAWTTPERAAYLLHLVSKDPIYGFEEIPLDVSSLSKPAPVEIRTREDLLSVKTNIYYPVADGGEALITIFKYMGIDEYWNDEFELRESRNLITEKFLIDTIIFNENEDPDAAMFAYEAANDSDETIHYSDLPPEARDVLINATVRLKIYN